VLKMSSYTTQLKTIIESPTQFQTGLSTRDKIELGRKTLFDFDYPIFNEAYRKDFETHFIRHFYMREIGAETEGLFKFNLETWLLINMPYFNKMFESELIEYDPLTNSKASSTHNKTLDRGQTDTRSTTGNTTSEETQDQTATSENFNRSLESDTPDNRLAITTNDGEGVIEYASKIDEDKLTGNSTQNSTSNNTQDSTIDDTLNRNINDTETFEMSREGKIGIQTYAKMIQEHRSAFLRIEKQMFDEMQELFMMVY
jgi:hypothetical protein